MTPWPPLANRTTRDQRRAERQQARSGQRYTDWLKNAAVKRPTDTRTEK